MSLNRFVVAGLVAAACFSGGCENGAEEVDASHDRRLVGDWRTISDGGSGAEIEITTLKASGDIAIGGFYTVGDFSIEGWEDIGIWRTSNDTLYETYEEFGAIYTEAARYAVSGNRVTRVHCDGRYCDTAVAEKADVAAIRKGLGTVRGQDPALFKSTVYDDLMWYLDDDDDDYAILDFDLMYFWDGERYFGYDWYDDQVWYTDGSRLFLIGINDDGETKGPVELEYKVAGVGSAARLLIRPVLPDGTLGPEDIWLPTEYDDWGSYKSKAVKKAAKKRKSAFAPALRVAAR